MLTLWDVTMDALRERHGLGRLDECNGVMAGGIEVGALASWEQSDEDFCTADKFRLKDKQLVQDLLRERIQ